LENHFKATGDGLFDIERRSDFMPIEREIKELEIPRTH
jgi:hypothetical protein